MLVFASQSTNTPQPTEIEAQKQEEQALAPDPSKDVFPHPNIYRVNDHSLHRKLHSTSSLFVAESKPLKRILFKWCMALLLSALLHIYLPIHSQIGSTRVQPNMNDHSSCELEKG